MTGNRIPKWVWYLCAAGTFVGLVLVLVRGNQADEAPKPTQFVSIYGEPVAYLSDQVWWFTGKPMTYLVTIPVSQSADEDQRTRQADETFASFAGRVADDMGFKRVIIWPDDGSRPGQIDIFGFKLSFHASVGVGPIPKTDLLGDIVYERQPNGIWSREGAQPGAPAHIQEVTLPSGAKFALTYDEEDFPTGWYVYECLSCASGNALQILAANLSALMQDAFKIADRNHLQKLHVAIFSTARKSTWQFPTALRVATVRRNGQWIVPKVSPQQIQSAMLAYAREMKARGAKLRGGHA